MVIENPLPPFDQWLPIALLWWVGVSLVLTIAGVAVGYIVAAFRHGPARAAEITGTALRSAVADFLGMSAGRVFALARLAMQESFRRRVLVVLVVFFVVLGFAAWFLDSENRDVGKLYVNFVLTATTYLSMLLALFLSVFSLPNDLKQRTIYTIVTKPVRPVEIVLGRILGFMACGTVMLAVMGVVGYVFVVRGVQHTHTIDPVALVEVDASNPDVDIEAEHAATLASDDAEQRTLVKTGRTSIDEGHRHDVEVYDDGTAGTTRDHGHWHDVAVSGEGDDARFDVSQPRGMYTAKVPVYGTLTFKDRQGNPAARGINVGNEWEYRSYIEGGTLAAAVWRFEGITPEEFPDGLPVEMTIRVFRSYKGEISEGILGSLVIRNPQDENIRSSEIPFEAEEYSVQQIMIGRTLTNVAGEPVDLFEEFVVDGVVELVMRCETPQQYFGMAQADVYLRARDASFAMNFFKAHVGIWLQMLLVTGYGVMFSTFLNGPVSMLAAIATMLGGFLHEHMNNLIFQRVQGGGPLESFIRIVNQDNLIVELEAGPMKYLALTVDTIMRPVIFAVSAVLPDFTSLNLISYVADGYNVPDGTLLIETLTALSYMLPLIVAGYFFLKLREVGK
ncbi:MAG: hypothetical protein R3C10_06755 [Pirellulales bacterium]